MQTGLTVKVAAGLMEWSEPKLWRIETGQTTLRALDVQARCTTYDAPPDLTQTLAALASQARAHGWWRAYGEAIPDDFSICTALEDTASAPTGYAPGQVPGLLRTDAYAHALITSTSSGETDRLVHDCMARRALLTRTRAPLSMTLALDEALLRRPIGGPAVMAGQLRYLADMAAQPTVSLHIVPYGAGHHPGLITGAFTLLDLPPAKRDGDTSTAIVYAAGLTGELYWTSPITDTTPLTVAAILDDTGTPGTTTSPQTPRPAPSFGFRVYPYVAPIPHNHGLPGRGRGQRRGAMTGTAPARYRR